MKKYNEVQIKRRIKWCICILIAGLALSGITAFPLETELSWLNDRLSASSAFSQWFNIIYAAIKHTNEQYPYLSYGTDWLAFAHLMLAILFIGPLHDPVKNKWVIEFGMIACVLILPLAFIAGPIRHIPLFWRCIDSSFGIIGIVPLLVAYRYVKVLEKAGVFK